ncbi:hypothetical protein BCR43DRAFT_489518 [Syncephalastrum racemosum]|uniref:Uncharacterized protein n=1 Tax=Syncephalastrum racemosum TaxID=13706 RepID=A0A1X2HEE0_SYNRA|nr:hypothetical protein BCR43DRAFT_489518 [Syncephalastrum racemosum]
MSAAATSTPTRDWLLPMPSEIGIQDDSFSADLIRQFDMRRSRLREHSTAGDQERRLPSGESRPNAGTVPPSNTSNTTTSNSSSSSSRRDSSRGNTNNSHPYGQERERGVRDDGRRRSAGDLLRRSSAYLRAKIEALRGTSRSHDNLRPPSSASLPPPSRLVVNTTIAIPLVHTPSPSHQHHHRGLSPAAQAIQPPIITHYPPRPLQYAPVEPLSDADIPSKSIRHRISLPVLRRHHHTQHQNSSSSSASSSNNNNNNNNNQNRRRQSDGGVQHRARKSPSTFFEGRHKKRAPVPPMPSSAPATVTSAL